MQTREEHSLSYSLKFTSISIESLQFTHHKQSLFPLKAYIQRIAYRFAVYIEPFYDCGVSTRAEKNSTFQYFISLKGSYTHATELLLFQHKWNSFISVTDTEETAKYEYIWCVGRKYIDNLSWTIFGVCASSLKPNTHTHTHATTLCWNICVI